MGRRPDNADYRARLEPVFRGRRFVLIGGTIAGLIGLARELVGLGAERPFLLGLTAAGAPAEHEFDWHALEPPARGAIEATWRYEAALDALPRDVQERIDAWDPERRARACGYIVLGPVERVAGRGRYADRPPAWVALEDKTRLHQFLDAIGVRRGPLAVVRAERDALHAAHARLDRGAGTVWSGDTLPGVHGGATFVRRVNSPDAEREASAFLARHCARVRVMPFVEGVPCSVHGLVLPGGVAVFRPVEMVTLRRPGTSEFVYAGTGTYWDPPPADREAMRALARRVGLGLRETVGYRGVFTLDGVLGADGFVPTELNPRIGAGFLHLMAACPELSLGPLALAVQHGESLDLDADDLERRVLAAADARRSGSGRIALPRTPARAGAESCPLVRDSGGFRPARSGESVDGTIRVGPSNIGSWLHFWPGGERPPGAPLAPDVVRAFAAADARFGTGIGALEAARCTRTRAPC